MFNVGDVITDDGEWAARDQNGDPVFITKWNDYPHIFEPIPWWSNRTVEDMPAFIKRINDNHIGKVFRWDNDFNDVFVDYKDNRELTKDYIPATEEDYNNYKRAQIDK